MALSSITTAEPNVRTTCAVDDNCRHCVWTMDTDPYSTNTLDQAVSISS